MYVCTIVHMCYMYVLGLYILNYMYTCIQSHVHIYSIYIHVQYKGTCTGYLYSHHWNVTHVHMYVELKWKQHVHVHVHVHHTLRCSTCCDTTLHVHVMYITLRRANPEWIKCTQLHVYNYMYMYVHEHTSTFSSHTLHVLQK